MYIIWQNKSLTFYRGGQKKRVLLLKWGFRQKRKFKTYTDQGKYIIDSNFLSYRMSIHFRHLHWSVSTEVVDPDHVISATGGHEHTTFESKQIKHIKHI